ncbi:hypothetical protein S83_054682 [Arachis hypogaea]
MPYHINLKGSSISLTFGNDHCLPCAWNKLRKENLSVVPFRLPRGTRTGTLLIKAVATFELKILPHKRDECTHSTDLHLAIANSAPGFHLDSSDEESQELDEREKLRRMRISKANKGNTPWNKGRKHSPETLRKIRERTRLAMQNPKVMSYKNDGSGETLAQEIYGRRKTKDIDLEGLKEDKDVGDDNGPLLQVGHDMRSPLAHYFLYTGHNSYLTVRHGRTLTSPLKLRACLKAIKEYAFYASNKYPVVITFEDHITPPLQAKVAKVGQRKIMRE